MGATLALLLLACGRAPAPEVASASGASAGRLSATAVTGEAPVLCINEVMPGNDATLVFSDGSSPDWIELANPTGADVSLAGWSIADDREDDTRHALSGALSVPAGGTLLLYADERTDAGDDHLPFQLAAEGEEVALFDPEGDGTVLAFGVVYDDYAVARATDCCAGEGCLDHVFRGSPGVSNDPVVTTRETLVAAGSTWRYRDDGALSDAGWTAAAFDDAAWAEGPAPLGYGDSQATVLSYGPDAASKYITTWFRLDFELVDAAAISALELGLARDDGALVWLNGVEIARSNLPEGVVTAATLASASVSDADETAFFAYTVDPLALVEGNNVLAVEVHQATVDSSDLTLDLELVATRSSSR